MKTLTSISKKKLMLLDQRIERKRRIAGTSGGYRLHGRLLLMSIKIIGEQTKRFFARMP